MTSRGWCKTTLCAFSLFASACVSSPQGHFLIDKIGFVGLTDDLAGAQFIETVKADACKGTVQSASAESLAYSKFMEELKRKGVRYVTDLECHHVTKVVPVPVTGIGGTVYCVEFEGKAYR